MNRTSRIVLLVGLCGVAVTMKSVLSAQSESQAAPQLHHWILPVDQSGVEVATLHPNDCYVVRSASGVAFFGQSTDEMRALQHQFVISTAHAVVEVEDHPECTRRACLEVNRLTDQFERAMNEVNQRQIRSIDHRPNPADSFYGGAYTDVGSEERERFRNLPEQRMLFQHLETARRDNCYEAKMPRTLTIHVRDHERRLNRSGVYQGYLYVEHHHPEITGKTVAD
ncbi:MAG: hypothetical protein VX262_08745 [Acidobacteriota bacterium]|nr:hypothetical protein [Acidobacteriota bacterium]